MLTVPKSNYLKIHRPFGMEDFNRLVAELRKRNIKLVMDLVVNHTSTEVIMSASDLTTFPPISRGDRVSSVFSLQKCLINANTNITSLVC